MQYLEQVYVNGWKLKVMSVASKDVLAYQKHCHTAETCAEFSVQCHEIKLLKVITIILKAELQQTM